MIKMLKMHPEETMKLVKEIDRFLIDQMLVDSETYMITPISASEALVESRLNPNKPRKNKQKTDNHVVITRDPDCANGLVCKKIFETGKIEITTSLETAMCWLLDKEMPPEEKVLRKYYNEQYSYLIEDLADDLAERMIDSSLKSDIFDVSDKKNPVRIVTKDRKLTLLMLQKLARHYNCWATDDKEISDLISSIVAKHVDKFKELSNEIAQRMKDIAEKEKTKTEPAIA